MVHLKTPDYPKTNFKSARIAYARPQREFAEISCMGLHSIQMYEQRNKDINKAQVDSLYRLAEALGYAMEDLLEE